MTNKNIIECFETMVYVWQGPEPLGFTVGFLFSVVMCYLRLQVPNLVVSTGDNECRCICRYIWSGPREQVLSQLEKCLVVIRYSRQPFHSRVGVIMLLILVMCALDYIWVHTRDLCTWDLIWLCNDINWPLKGFDWISGTGSSLTLLKLHSR